MKINLKYQFNTSFLNSAILTAILLFFLQTTTLFSSVDIIGTVTAKRGNSLKVEFQSHKKATPKRDDKVEFSLRFDGELVGAGMGEVTEVNEDAVWVQISNGQPDLQMDAVIHTTGSKVIEPKIEQPRNTSEYKREKAESFTKYKVVNVANNDTLNIRSNPYVRRNNKVGHLKPYTDNIEVLECKLNYKSKKWCMIRHKERGHRLLGWVSARFIAPSNTLYVSGKRYRVVKVRSDDTLSVRDGSGLQYYKIGDLPYNAESIKIIRCRKSTRSDKWCKIKYGSTSGWVSAAHLQEQ